MKYIKKFRIFESIEIDKNPKIISAPRVFDKKDFSEKEFNTILLDDNFIDGVKDYLYDLSEVSDIKISFKRTLPLFKKDKRFHYTMDREAMDLMVVEIKSSDYYSTSIPRTQATPRTYIDSKILEDTALSLQIHLQDLDFNISICESYFTFSSIEDFFSKEKKYLSDVSLIIF
jgi:hypothetical protein